MNLSFNNPNLPAGISKVCSFIVTELVSLSKRIIKPITVMKTLTDEHLDYMNMKINYKYE